MLRRSWFPLFADCLLLGVFVLLTSLPLVTLGPAVVAGCVVLREQAAGNAGVTLRHFVSALRRVLRTGPAVCLVPAGVLALLWLDALALDARGSGLGPVFAAATAVLGAFGLRCAAAWREGLRWRVVLVAAFRSMPQQPLVLVLLAGSTAASAVLLTMAPVLLLIILGPLVLAATAADAWRALPL